jgi:NADPH2:quinone reductase
MRAYGFTAIGGPDTEAFLDVPEPTPGEGELLVRVRAAGVNPGDWRVRDGSYGIDGPAVLGREVAGTVLATGDGVTDFAPGDEVFGGCPGMLGGWAPMALVTASYAAHRPDGVSPERAAVLPVAAGTALSVPENVHTARDLLVCRGGGQA